MARRRAKRPGSTAVQVLGVFHLVGGIFGLFGTLIAIYTLVVAMTATPGPPAPPAPPPGFGRPGGPPPVPAFDQAELEAAMQKSVPGYRAFQITEVGIGFVFDVMLITAGIGLFRHQSWGRTLSLVWAPLSILNKVLATSYQLLFLVPAFKSILLNSPAFTNIPAPQRAVFETIFTVSMYAGIVGGAILIAYPIITLFILLNATVARSFTVQPEEDFDDPDDERGDDRDEDGREGDRDSPRDRQRWREEDRGRANEGFRRGRDD